MEQVYLVCRHREIPNIHQYDVYVSQAEGYKGLEKALSMSRDEAREIVFSAGRLWA